MQNTPKNRNRVALLTGASSEIGRQIALTLARTGYNVVLLGRNTTRLEGVAQEVKELRTVAALVLECNISEPGELERAFNKCIEEYDRINVLVNIAGIFDWASSLEADLEIWSNLINVNLTAAMRATRLALPYIVQEPGGAIIFIASLAAKYSFGMNAAYVASKHGLLGFAGSVFEDVRKYNVKVCTICPGNVNAGASLALKKEPSDLIQAEDIARTIEYILGFGDNACPTEIVIQPQRDPSH